MAGLHSGSYVATMYEALYNCAEKTKNLNRFHAFQESGLDKDEYSESLNNLLDCRDAYQEQYIWIVIE